MKPKNYGYMNDVDDLIQRTPLDVVLNHYGLPLNDGSTEYRMNCVFNEGCAESQYGNLSVGTDSFKRIYTHCCKVKGNLLTLIHGLEHRQPPTGGKLRGQEFKDAVARLREMNDSGRRTETLPSAAIQPTETPTAVPQRNAPLIRHEKEAAQKLADLYEDLIADPAEMSPEAARYVRARTWMTSDLMSKWGVGWIPGNGRSLFRKSYLVYTHRDENDHVVSYSGRDLSFEAKFEQWLRHGKPDGKKPGKHRYVKGFQRGLELYGGHASRLNEQHVKQSLAKRGLLVVEGMNEVLRMDSLGICAVGLGSNTATDTQVGTLIRNARAVASNRILLLPDCDTEGETGFRDLLWNLSEAQVAVRLGVSSVMFGGRFAGRQPESFTDEEWREIDKTFAESK